MAALPDPPIPADGSCAVCGKPRKLSGLKAVYLREAERDPFCSATCARAWHGVPLPEPPQRRVDFTTERPRCDPASRT